MWVERCSSDTDHSHSYQAQLRTTSTTAHASQPQFLRPTRVKIIEITSMRCRLQKRLAWVTNYGKDKPQSTNLEQTPQMKVNRLLFLSEHRRDGLLSVNRANRIRQQGSDRQLDDLLVLPRRRRQRNRVQHHHLLQHRVRDVRVRRLREQTVRRERVHAARYDQSRSTPLPPCSFNWFAALHSVPAVSIMSSTMMQSESSIVPTRSIESI